MNAPRYTWDPTANARKTRPHALRADGERACESWYSDMPRPVVLGTLPRGACEGCWRTAYGHRKGFRARAFRPIAISPNARAITGIPSVASFVHGWSVYWASVAAETEREAKETAPDLAADMRRRAARYARMAAHLAGPGLRKAHRAETLAAQWRLACWLLRSDGGTVAGQQLTAWLLDGEARTPPLAVP